MNLAGIYVPATPQADAVRILRQAYDRGVTFFDTAQLLLSHDHHAVRLVHPASNSWYAKIYAEVKIVRDENKIVGYIISAVDVVVAGVAIFGGIMMMSSMTPLGVVAGPSLW